MRKLGVPGGLQELVVAGLKHKPTLENLCNRLLKIGGRFHVVD